MFPKKGRIDGSPSESIPPPGLPSWALDKDWIEANSGNGIQIFMYTYNNTHWHKKSYNNYT